VSFQEIEQKIFISHFFLGSVIRIASKLNFSGAATTVSPNEIQAFWAGAIKVTFDGFADKADNAEFERQFVAGFPKWLSGNLNNARDLMQDFIDYDGT
jgi:hypothetical protein